MMKQEIRQIQPEEYGFLKTMLYQAIGSSTGKPSPDKKILLEPQDAAYVHDFGNPGDIGLVAAEEGRLIGAAWARQLRSHSFIDDLMPELFVALLPEYRGKGLGTKLLHALFDQLRLTGAEQVSLRVEKRNPALRLFQRLGFELADKTEGCYTMLKQLGAQAEQAASVAIIGGASGPTAIYTAGFADPSPQNAAVPEEILRQIKPCAATTQQLESHLIEHYQAIPYPLSPRERDLLKANVILNYFSDVIDRPKPPGPKATRAELVAYVAKDRSFEQARNYPAEKLGLQLKAYRLGGSHTEALVLLETTTGYYTVHNGSSDLDDELTLFKGVSLHDIDQQTPQLMIYAQTLVKQKDR